MSINPQYSENTKVYQLKSASDHFSKCLKAKAPIDLGVQPELATVFEERHGPLGEIPATTKKPELSKNHAFKTINGKKAIAPTDPPKRQKTKEMNNSIKL